MRIVHISYSRAGGIGNSVEKLVEAQRAQGAEVSWIYLTTKSLWDAPWMHPIEVLKASVDYYILSSKKHPSPVSLLRGSLPLRLRHKLRKAVANVDIIHFHGFDLHGVRLKQLAGKKIIVSLHDFRPLSGACHQPAECSRYKDSCNSCPAVRHFAKQVVRQKAATNKSMLADEHVQLAAPSRWMGELVESGLIPIRKKVELLPNINRLIPIEITDSPRESILILSSTAPSSLRKLSKEDLEKLSRLADDLNAPLISLGANTYPPPVMNNGVVPQAELEVQIRRARLVVIPSRWESFSQIASTALKLQTPVCSFTGGAVEEMASKFGLFIDIKREDLTRAFFELSPQIVSQDFFSEKEVMRAYNELIDPQ